MKTHTLASSLIVLPLLVTCHPAQAEGETTRVSVSSKGEQATCKGKYCSSSSWGPVLSADGRFVAFSSSADNLVDGDTDDYSDIFVHDRRTEETTRVSVSSTGQKAPCKDNPSKGQYCFSSFPVLSADGRFVAFSSYDDNLVPGDTNGWEDVFVHDRRTGNTRRVSISSTGQQANHISSLPTLSADGRFVAFQSSADNLAPGDDPDSDIFVYDQLTGNTTLVSVSTTGEPATRRGSLAPALSADGRFVAFESVTNNLVPGDTNDAQDIFVHDRRTGTTIRVNIGSTAQQANNSSYRPAFSADGRFVGFSSDADNLVPKDTNRVADVFVHDRKTGQTSRVSISSKGKQANRICNQEGDCYGSFPPALSADGRFVAFSSYADNLVPGDTNDAQDIFVHDRRTGNTTRVSISSTGQQTNGFSLSPVLSADGRFVAFISASDNLVPGDTNRDQDIFVRDRLLNTVRFSDIAITAIKFPETIEPNGALTYRITVTNHGFKTATGVALTAVLSSHLTLLSTKTNQGKCSKAHVLVCRLRNLPRRASARVAVKVKVNSGAQGTLRSTVSVAANERDGNGGNNRKVVAAQVIP